MLEWAGGECGFLLVSGGGGDFLVDCECYVEYGSVLWLGCGVDAVGGGRSSLLLPYVMEHFIRG